MTLPNVNRTALAATFGIYLILAALLLFFGLKRTIPNNQEEGLFVNFGTVDASSGLFEPMGTQQQEQVAEAAPESSSEELITQDMEASVNLEEKKKEQEAEKVRSEQERKASEIRQQTANVFARSSSESSSQGTAATGTGNQGNPNGDPNSDNTKGGGQGYGNFSLDGRSVTGALPRPSYAIQEEGIVVVRIVVNPKGSVVSASVNLQGTTTESPTLRSAALSAAKNARFNDITGSQNQSGTITYRFRLR